VFAAEVHFNEVMRTSKFVIEPMERRALLSAPIVITKGGTYTGSWTSTDRLVPAVTIATSAPVTIINSTVRGPGNLIINTADHVNVTIKNTKAFGANPNVFGRAKGHFVDIDNFDNAVIQDNTLESIGGVHLLNYIGNHTSTNTIKVIGNVAHNIDGRKSDGKGWYIGYNTRFSKKDGHREDGFEYAQFLQLDKCRAVGSVDIAWNRVTNDVGSSRVEDNINIFLSSGTSASPIKIHDNLIQGAYTIKPWATNTEDSTWRYDWSYSGGGINLGDGMAASSTLDPAYVRAFGNTVIDTTNYGIALSAGHNLEAYSNRVFACGKLPDGRTSTQQNVGIYVWDSYRAGPTRFYNNTGHDNVVGWVTTPGGRNDWWIPDAKTFVNNIHWAGTVTETIDLHEVALWKAKFS
jgi:hypothetical protein